VPTVLLLGYSCAGKSTIVREVRDRWPEVEGLDSDDWVAEPYGAHIYEVFFRLGRLAALDQIAYREGLFLDALEPVDGPRVIAAGPALPSRKEWTAFVGRVQPTFVYLELTPEEELIALRGRRAKHADTPGIAGHRLFGSWDEGLTTIRQPGPTWADVDDAEALENIRREMRQLVAIYEQHTDVEHRYSKEARWGFESNRIVEDIGRLLRVG